MRVAQHDHDLERPGKVLQGIAQAAHALTPEHVACDSDHEEVVETLLQDHLGGSPRIGAGKDRRKRRLHGALAVSAAEVFHGHWRYMPKWLARSEHGDHAGKQRISAL